jgi:integrase
MATISKYQTASGATFYRVRYRTPDRGETQKRGFATKRDAEIFAASVEVSKLKGEYVAPALGRATVAELAPDWLARKQSKAPSHYRMLESAWRVHVQPRWGAMRVADVGSIGVEDWIAAMLDKGSGATTVLRAHGVLSGILADAVKAKRIAVNPTKGVENLPRKVARRHVYLSAADVERLADESGQHRVLVLVLAYCGLRVGRSHRATGARCRVPAPPAQCL